MNPAKALTSYVRSSVEEAKKVSWPTRKETIRFSTLVVGVSLLVAVFFGAIDAGFTKLVSVTLATRQLQSAPAAVPTQAPVTPTVETAPGSAQPTVNLEEVQPIVTPTEGATQ